MAKKKASGWKGGSFKAAVGMYAKKKAKKTAKSAGKKLRKGLRQVIFGK